MACPACADADAYVGLSGVECPNKECRHYSARQAEDVARSKGEPTPGEGDDEDVVPQYLWAMHHFDFGM